MHGRADILFFVDVLIGLNAKLRRVFSEVRLAESSRCQRIFLLSYSLFYENITTCLTLLKNGHFHTVPLVLRSALEGYADVVNIPNDPTYAEMLLCSVDIKRLASLRHLEKIYPLGRDVLQAEISSMEEIVSRCSDSRFKRLSIRDKMELAGVTQHYNLLYKFFSGFIHNDFHISFADCDDMSCPALDLCSARKVEDRHIFMYVFVIYSIIANAAMTAKEYIGESDEAMLTMFFEEWQSLRSYFDKARAKFQPTEADFHDIAMKNHKA